MAVPNIFGSATAAIPLSQLDTNFATPVTIGNTAVQLGNTVTSFGNVTLTNVTISSGNVTVTSPAIFPAGSNSAPSITTTGDTNTGIFFPAADTIAFSEGGVEAARFDSAGNLGVGTTSPATRIHAVATGGAIRMQDTTATAKYIQMRSDSTNSHLEHVGGPGDALRVNNQAAGTIEFYTSNTERARIDSSGNLGIGTSSIGANHRLEVSGNQKYFAFTGNTGAGGPVNPSSSSGLFLGWNQSNGGGESNIVYGTGSGSSTGLQFASWNGTTYTEQARIDSSGNLLVGTTSDVTNGGMKIFPNYDATGSTSFEIGHITGSSTGNRFGGFKYAGTLIGTITQNGTTGVLYNLTSDYRLKNDQQALTGAKDFIMSLKPKKWQWWDGSGEGVGFVAHEFMEVAKHSGNGEKDAIDSDGKPVYQSIQPSSSEVMANLVAFIQEQQALITQLTARITALEGA